MTNDRQNDPPGFYFALPRLLHRSRARTIVASEGSALEAYLGSVALFVIPYLLTWNMVANIFTGWRLGIAAVLLVFAVWIFWLAAFFQNSLNVKTLRMLGLFRKTPTRTVQNVLTMLVLAALASALSLLPDWTRWIGILFLVALAANLVAAALLGLLRRNL